MRSRIGAYVRQHHLALLCLFLILGSGTAWAATNLSKNDVRSKHIKNRSVKTQDLANGAVNSKKVADGSLRSVDFAPNQLPQGDTGPQGPQGEVGPEGPSTGPAGGDLTGNYPDPSIASGAVGAPELEDEAVTGAAVAPNSLGGDQINESSLQGVDKSAVSGSFLTPAGSSGSSNIGGGLMLGHRCTGSAGNIGAEVFVKNESGFTRTVYAYAITEGGTAQIERVSIANGATATVIDIAESTTSDGAHWVTVLFTQNIYKRYEHLIRTKFSGNDTCDGYRFQTSTTG